MNGRSYLLGLFIFLLTGFPPIVSADAIQPDRPGFSTGTYTVEPGFTQLELGFQSSYGNNAGDPDTFTAPLINVRVSLNSTTELNILLDGWSWERTGSNTVTSTSDMLVGAKHRLLTADKYNLSLLGFVSLPTGNSADSGYFTPFIGLLWDYELTTSVGAFGTLQFVSFVEAGERSNNFQPAIGLSFSHTNTISTYVEYYRDISLNLKTSDADMFDAGITYLLTNDIQLDFNFGISLDNVSDDFIAAGFAIRF